jgi:cobalamin biosynthesis protein CbiD
MDPEDIRQIGMPGIGELFHEGLQRGFSCAAMDARPQKQIDDGCAPRISQQLQREIDVAVIPSESRRCDAYDLEVPVIKLQSAAHDIRIG